MNSARDISRGLAAVDSAIYAAVATTQTPALDRAMRHLSAAADHSKISLAVAGLLALRPGKPRRAALRGVAAVAATSAATNLVAKQLVRRPRPIRAAETSPGRYVPMPNSASFPSGHTASAFAFAYAVGSTLPAAVVPLGALAFAVGYSRVHTGVHFPGDVAAGAMIGIAGAAAVSALAGRWETRTRNA